VTWGWDLSIGIQLSDYRRACIVAGARRSAAPRLTRIRGASSLCGGPVQYAHRACRRRDCVGAGRDGQPGMRPIQLCAPGGRITLVWAHHRLITRAGVGPRVTSRVAAS
jgi:hypothetical protein